MGYDFFVYPAELADGLQEAESLYETSPPTGTTTPGSPLARFRASLQAVPDILTQPVTGHDAAAYVCTGWSHPMAHLRTVTDLARREGLAVLDVQLRSVYDPRGSVDVSVEVDGGPRLTWLTLRLLGELVGHVGEGRYAALTLDRGGERLSARTGDAALDENMLWTWATGG
jgi:hypothetical protein